MKLYHLQLLVYDKYYLGCNLGVAYNLDVVMGGIFHLLPKRKGKRWKIRKHFENES